LISIKDKLFIKDKHTAMAKELKDTNLEWTGYHEVP
jgi:hypothetical protein